GRRQPRRAGRRRARGAGHPRANRAGRVRGRGQARQPALHARRTGRPPRGPGDRRALRSGRGDRPRRPEDLDRRLLVGRELGVLRRPRRHLRRRRGGRALPPLEQGPVGRRRHCPRGRPHGADRGRARPDDAGARRGPRPRGARRRGTLMSATASPARPRPARPPDGPTHQDPERRRALRRRRRSEAVAAYGFLSPWLLGLMLITIGPMIASLVLSFTRYELIGSPEFVGLENYQRMLFEDPRWLNSVRVTLLYTGLSVPLVLAFALALAVFLNRGIRGLPIYRTLFYVP